MVFVLPAVLPIFALILVGWTARRWGLLGPNATGELNRFVIHLALPAVLFDTVANARRDALWQPGFVGAFGLGAAGVFCVTVVFSLRRRRPLADAAIDGLNTAYANTGFVGFPLALATLGPTALAATLIATILTVCVVFAVALVLIEVGLQSETHPRRMAMKVAASLGRNPLLIAPALGALMLASGVKPPPPAETFLKLLGGAASPCALIALGLFLAEERTGVRPALRTTSLLVGLKLIAQPVATWLLAVHLFHLTPRLTRAAVLLAALPTGTGPFMVAEFYRREAGLTARVVLITTILSLATITAYLSWS